jgi:hypothetical protein
MQKYLVNFLQCTKVRQLSREKVLTSVYELQKQLQLFFKDTVIIKPVCRTLLKNKNGC